MTETNETGTPGMVVDGSGHIDLDRMLEFQKKLEAFVPHGTTPLGFKAMEYSINEIEALLVYINALGRKPWRPSILPRADIIKREDELLVAQDTLLDYTQKTIYNHNNTDKVPPNSPSNFVDLNKSMKMVAVLGIIEEAIEFYREITKSPSEIEPDKVLEEQTDILFFYLVTMIGASTSWDDIVKRYHQKWEENMKRYEDLQKGDTRWDKRAEKGGSL
jgi:phosphoribosyl-ATP pyrophosphohydrolase